MSTTHGFYLAKREIHETIKQQCRRNFTTVLAVFHEICFRARWNGNIIDGLNVGEAFIGYEELGRSLGVSKRSVIRAIKWLEEAHLMSTGRAPKGTRVTICDLSLIIQSENTRAPEEHRKSTQTNTNTNTNTKKNTGSRGRGQGRGKAPSVPATRAELLTLFIKTGTDAGYDDEKFLREEFDACEAYWLDRDNALGRLKVLNWLRSAVAKDKWATFKREKAVDKSVWF